MRMMDELKHLRLYSFNKKVYAPIDEKDKRKNSAILLLSPNIETSSRMINLPYMYNPNLFMSLYIDRDINAYISNVPEEELNLDEKEEENLSEAMLFGWSGDTKFRFDDDVSTMDMRYTQEVFNQRTSSSYARMLHIGKVPEDIKIFVHPNVRSIQKDMPKDLLKFYNDKIYSYCYKNEIHVLSKGVYNENTMSGLYKEYLTEALIYSLICQYNPKLKFIPVKAISMVFSGVYEWMENNDMYADRIKSIDEFCKAINIMKDKGNIGIISGYIKSGNLYVFSRFIVRNAFNSAKDIFISEGTLSYFDRQRLLPSDFGIPDKRKYPMPDADHVRLAIKMFNHCDEDEEKELAQAILRKMKKFGIDDIEVGKENRFGKYYHPKKKDEVKTESAPIDDKYKCVLNVCSKLSPEEFKLISFDDVYKDSKFVIKRIIARDKDRPIGFLDVYHFPSNPAFAQIVIAVDPEYRGMGVSDMMVNGLLNSNLEKDHDFKMYYWTAHPFNNASMNLALKHGFEDMHAMDSYGRKIFTKLVPREIEKVNLSEVNSVRVSDGMSILTEANTDKYSKNLRRYLYAERLRNNKAVLNLYDSIKASNPNIKRTYINLKMYKNLNVFIDLSYYHGLFLKNNSYKMDRGVNIYFDFLNRLLNNEETNQYYSKKTIFIPVDAGVWNVGLGSDITDYKKNLNPISLIFRLMRTNPTGLKRAWGNKHFVFVGSKGYFTIDFSKLELKDLTKIKTNLRKLMSATEVIEDEEDPDELMPDTSETSAKNVDSPKAMAAKMVDKIEKGTKVNLPDISAINDPSPKGTDNTENIMLMGNSPHLTISKKELSINPDLSKENNGIAIITIDPDGPDGVEKLNKSLLKNVSDIPLYCIPD